MEPVGVFGYLMHMSVFSLVNFVGLIIILSPIVGVIIMIKSETKLLKFSGGIIFFSGIVSILHIMLRVI